MISLVTTRYPGILSDRQSSGATQFSNISPVPAPAPPRQKPRTTASTSWNGVPSTGPSVCSKLEPIEALAAFNLVSLDTAPDAVELEVWEGVVLAVDSHTRTMQVRMEAKNSNLAPHTAKISFDFIAEQDLDLVRPGAVFYLTLFNQILRGTVRNSQELRFRRRPDWTKQQLETIESDAKALRGKIKARPPNA